MTQERSGGGIRKGGYETAELPGVGERPLLYELTGAGAWEGLSALLTHTREGGDWHVPLTGAIFSRSASAQERVRRSEQTKADAR